MTNLFLAAMVLDPFVVYIVGMSLVIGLAVIFLLSLRYYIKAKDLAPYLHKIEELVAKISEKQGEIDDAEKKLKDLKLAVAEADATIARGKVAEEWLKKAKDEIENTQKEIVRVREALEPLKNEHERLTALMSEKQQILTDQERRAVDAENRLRQAELATVEEQKKCDELALRVNGLENQVKRLINEISDLNTKQQMRNTLVAEVESLKATKERLSLEIKTLEVLKKSLDEAIDKIRIEIEKGKDIIARGEAFRTQTGNMWNDLERPVATIVGKSSDKSALDDEQRALETFIENLSDSHFKFNERTIKAFHTGLLCGDISPLVVLAGISGTGKSLLPELYASHFGMNFLPVAIQPRWDGPQDMFGFYNHMEGRYKATELSRLLYQFDIYNNPLASKTYKEQSTLPMSIVLLDEMNLARIEYYFSELLSKLEIRRNVVDLKSKMDRFKAEIELEYGAPAIGTDNGKSSQIEGKRIFAARNILFIGTMNEDESTQTLSSKVIDRSNVLRFGIPGMLKQAPDRKAFDERCKWYVPFGTWDKWAQIKGAMPGGINIDDLIKQLNIALDSVDRGFGLRTETAFKTYVQRYPGMKRDAIADQVAMKVLPRLNGVERDVVRGRAQSAISKVLQAVGDERVLTALDNALSDSASSFFSWKGVNWEGAAG